mgnify:CR=1 FL=1
MTVPALTYSADQAAAFDSVTEMLRHAGIDLADNLLMPPAGGADQVLAVTGKAGSGKTLLLAELYKFRVITNARRKTSAPWPFWHPPTRRHQSCGCAVCPRRRSTASSIRLSMTPNTNASQNGWRAAVNAR